MRCYGEPICQYLRGHYFFITWKLMVMQVLCSVEAIQTWCYGALIKRGLYLFDVPPQTVHYTREGANRGSKEILSLALPVV